jgi:hypothetical protein
MFQILQDISFDLRGKSFVIRFFKQTINFWNKKIRKFHFSKLLRYKKFFNGKCIDLEYHLTAKIYSKPDRQRENTSISMTIWRSHLIQNLIGIFENAAPPRRPLFDPNTDHFTFKNLVFCIFALFSHFTLLKIEKSDNTTWFYIHYYNPKQKIDL